MQLHVAIPLLQRIQVYKHSTMKKLYAIGIGPGCHELIAPKAIKAIKESSDLVAYGFPDYP